MIFFNKLILVDLFLLAGFISLFFVHAAAIRDVLFGFTAAVLIISIAQHFNHYKSYRKFF
jgi:hypothetical protein